MSLLTSHSYLGLRILAGVAVFTALGAHDLYRHGQNARRWKEYLFLLLCVAVALLYGIVNDQFSVSISWEYFYYGKDLSQALGPTTPPAQWPLRLEAAKIGMMATWSAGLLIAVALLIANNPRRDRPSLPLPTLTALLPPIFLITIFCAIVGAIAGHLGLLDWCSADFSEMRRDNLWRPARFISAWSEHLGSYLGGLLGTLWAVLKILHLRRPPPQQPEAPPT